MLSKEITLLSHFYSTQNVATSSEYKIRENPLLVTFVVCVCACSHHRSSVCAEQCALSCDWRSTPGDRVGTSGRTLAPHSTAAELEADGADTHSRSPRARSQTRTYNNNNDKDKEECKVKS